MYISQEGELNFETSVVQNKAEKTILMALQALNSTYLLNENMENYLVPLVGRCYLFSHGLPLSKWVECFFYSFTRLMVA